MALMIKADALGIEVLKTFSVSALIAYSVHEIKLTFTINKEDRYWELTSSPGLG